MRTLTTTIARVLFALPFALFGISHLFNGRAMAGYVPVPGGIFWVYFTGLAMIAASIGLLTKILGKWAALGLAAPRGLHREHPHPAPRRRADAADGHDQPAQGRRIVRCVADVGGAARLRARRARASVDAPESCLNDDRT
jgi:hypothetical protein